MGVQEPGSVLGLGMCEMEHGNRVDSMWIWMSTEYRCVKGSAGTRARVIESMGIGTQYVKENNDINTQ